MEVNRGPGHILARSEPSSPSREKGAQPHPQFLAHVCCGQTAGRTRYGGRPRPRRRCVRWGQLPPKRNTAPVLDGEPAPLHKNGAEPPIFGPCLLWPNGWMNQDDTWYEGRPRPCYIVLDGNPAPPKGAQQPPFSAHIYCGHGRPSQLLLNTCLKF